MNKLLKLAQELDSKYSNEYKCRAECLTDVDRFLGACKRARVKVTDIRIKPIYIDNTTLIPDVEFTFSCLEDIKSLKHILSTVPDGHVMHETLAKLEDYSGERDFLEPEQEN